VLTATELDLSRKTAREKSMLPPVGHVSVGIDSYFSEELQIYNIPLSTTLYPDLLLQADLPLVSRSVDSLVGTKSETGIGDINISFKLRMDLAEKTEMFYLFSTRLPTGSDEKALGNGSMYDLTLAEKLVTWFGDYRSTFMAGISVPMLHAKLDGHDIKHNPTLSCMAAVEHSYFKPGFWLGVKVAGQYIFNSRLDGVYQHNSLATIDVIPEVTYYLTDALKLHSALFMPAYTNYDLPGADNKRGVVLNVGATLLF
jgi:hypothetical protein